MRSKINLNIILSIIGAIIGIIYGYFNQDQTNLILNILAHILYFSLLGFNVAIIINLLFNKKIQTWHIGSFLGLVAFLILVFFISFRFSDLTFYCYYFLTRASCDFSGFITQMVFQGPLPLHLLQIFLILLGMLFGLVIGNRAIINFRQNKK